MPVHQLLYYILEAVLIFVIAGAIFVLDFKWISGAAAIAGLAWLGQKTHDSL